MKTGFLAGKSWRVTVTFRGSYTIEEIRNIFRVMVDRLRISAENLPDMAVGRSNWEVLQRFMDQFEQIEDLDTLEELFLLTLSRMKCSTAGEPFILRGLLIDLALEGLENQDAGNQKWLKYAELYG
jgi:hypothetical protein